MTQKTTKYENAATTMEKKYCAEKYGGMKKICGAEKDSDLEKSGGLEKKLEEADEDVREVRWLGLSMKGATVLLVLFLYLYCVVIAHALYTQTQNLRRIHDLLNDSEVRLEKLWTQDEQLSAGLRALKFVAVPSAVATDSLSLSTQHSSASTPVTASSSAEPAMATATATATAGADD